MARFFLIDHSLRDAGGHHFDYVRGIAEAAVEAGLPTTIGCHRALANKKRSGLRTELERTCTLLPVFRDSVYQQDSHLAGLRKMKRQPSFPDKVRQGVGFIRSAKQQLDASSLLRRRNRFANRFLEDCQRLFPPKTFDFQHDDHVFLAAVSELELMGLRQFMSQHPSSSRAKWHLQFHFSLFNGRRPEYASQFQTLRDVQTEFKRQLSQLASHSIRFYATSATLAEQFNCLSCGNFEHLPYPVSADVITAQGDVHASAQSLKTQITIDPKSQPMQMVCAGGMRREKGQATQLQGVVDSIWNTHLKNGKLRLIVQRPKRAWPAKQKIELVTPETSAASDSCPVIEYADHPLPRADYLNLIRSADIGLFCYDSSIYYSRCAGILVEMLANGVPVIVPGGSWLADQIQRPVTQFIDDFQITNHAVRKRQHRDFGFDPENVPLAGGVWSFDQHKHPFVATTSRVDNERVAVVRFEWQWPSQHGTYCCVDLVQKDAIGNVVKREPRTVGIERNRSDAAVMFCLADSVERLEISLRNACGETMVTIQNFTVETYASDCGKNRSATPIGSVGVIATNAADLPRCVAEIVDNHAHYQHSAQQHAKYWNQRHHPNRTIERLLQDRVSDRLRA